MDDARLDLHYGSGFVVWHQKLIGQLNRRKIGLSILQGDPGTGKTT